MVCDHTFAKVVGEDVVNVFICKDQDTASKVVSPALAIDSYLYPIRIGCKYKDGKFYNVLDDGAFEEIKRNMSTDELVKDSSDISSVLAESILNTEVSSIKLNL